MKDAARTLDRIIGATIAQLRESGASNLTVGSVAKAAGVSTALVHYHFESKIGLLRVAAQRIAAERTERRAAPLGAAGLVAIDAMRVELERDADSGAERAWQDLLLLAREDNDIRRTVAQQRGREREVFATRLPELLGSLGAAPGADGEQLAALVTACLDGLVLGLATGTPRQAFRSAYDAFWLALIGSGSGRASR